VVYNSEAFNRHYNILYIVEFLILLAALGWSWMTTTGTWRKLYLQLFIATAVYIIAFQALNSALLRNAYYPGSSYDVLDNFATCLFIAIPLSFISRRMTSEDQPELPISLRWNVVWSAIAALAVLSVPVTGLWTLLQTNEPPALQRFRLAVTLIASAVLAICVFLRQRVMDTRLTGLVSTSQETLENLQRVQAELVANERLGSMGQLVAGAAHEINNPLTAVLGYSDLLASQASLSPAQTTLVSSISQEARRARNLVSDLLVFARKAPSEKAQIDVLPVLQRAIQMESGNTERASVQMVAKLPPAVSRIWGSTHELFQAFQQLLSGLADRMEQLGGGTLLVRIQQEKTAIQLEFSCLNSQGQSFAAALSPCLIAARSDAGLRFRAVQATIENHKGRVLAPDPGRVIVTLPASSEFAASASTVD
jgi:signal transduction histidine kinase